MKSSHALWVRQPQTGETWKWERTLSGYWDCHLELTVVPALLRSFLQWTVLFWPGPWFTNTETVLRLGILSRPSILNFICLKYSYNLGLINNVRTLYKYDLSHYMSPSGDKHLSTYLVVLTWDRELSSHSAHLPNGSSVEGICNNRWSVWSVSDASPHCTIQSTSLPHLGTLKILLICWQSWELLFWTCWGRWWWLTSSLFDNKH